MTASYNRDLRFQYPENWQLEETPESGVPRTISVTAPTGAFWSVTLVLPRDISREELLQQYMDTLESEYTGVEQEEFQERIGNLPALEGRELQFFCLDLLVRTRIVTVAHGPYFLLICCQAEDREFDQLEPVFQALSFSCLTNKLP